MDKSSNVKEETSFKLSKEEKDLLESLLQKDGAEVDQEIIEQIGMYTCNGPSAPRRITAISD